MITLFRRILAVYIGVLVLAFGSLSVAVDIGVKHFIVHQRVLTLTREADVLIPLVEHPGHTHSLSLTKRLIHRDEVVNHSNMAIIALTSHGTSTLRQFQQYFLSIHDVRAARAVHRISEGDRISFVGRLRPHARVDSLVVGIPIRHRGHVIGLLLLHTPLSYLALGRIARIIGLIAIPTVLLSILALYGVTRRFSVPLLSVTRAADSLGQGHFHERVPVMSHDEVGHLAETFNQMADRLDMLETLRRDLLAAVSHELRTPLTSVRGFVQGMLEGVIPVEDHPRYLATAHKELERLNNILTAMLDLSAIESGHMELYFHAVQWQSAIDEAYDRVRLRMEEKHLVWQDVSRVKDAVIWADQDRLTDLLFNLLDNAIRHTPDGGTITVESHLEGSHLVCMIQDTGEGIAAKDLPHIWERFYKSAPSDISDTQQTGLGLTITKHLVELMHGRIEVVSNVGHGTTFRLRFPIVTSSL